MLIKGCRRAIWPPWLHRTSSKRCRQPASLHSWLRVTCIDVVQHTQSAKTRLRLPSLTRRKRQQTCCVNWRRADSKGLVMANRCRACLARRVFSGLLTQRAKAGCQVQTKDPPWVHRLLTTPWMTRAPPYDVHRWIILLDSPSSAELIRFDSNSHPFSNPSKDFFYT